MSPGAKAIRPYVLRQWKALAGAGGATTVLTAADLAKPWPLALVVDSLLDKEAPFTLTSGDWRMLAGVAAIVLLIALAEAGAQYLSDLWLQSAGERIAHELRITVYDRLQALSLGFHQKREKGDLLTRVTGDVNAMGDLFAEQIGAIAQAALLGFGMTAVLLFLDPVLALVSIATSPLLLGISWVYRRKVRRTARVRRAHEGRIASIAGEALSAMAVVKAFGSERYESDRVRHGSERRMEVGVEVARMQAGFDGLVGAVRAVGTALVMVVGVLRVASGALSPGDLIVFVSYTRKAYNPLKSLARETAKVAATMAKADRIAEILASDEQLPEKPGAYRGPRAAGDVALEGVSFSYGPDRPVLRDMTLRVPAGSRVALMGPSGAGKSTLAALVARFHDPTDGRVLIDGRDARDCSLEWLRAQVAVVLQDTVLFSGTVRENIAYGSGAGDEEVCAAARAAAADAFIRELPQGYDTELGPQGVALSGGQRQRIGIARTLLRDPPILLLDEPTTSLDEDTEEQLLDGLRALMEGRTTVLVTHSQRLADLAGRVVRIEGGRIAGPRRPAVERLLDPGAMTEVLARSLAPGTDLGDVSVSRVVYKPGELLAVHFAARVDGARHDAVVTTVAGADLAASVRKPRYADRARRINGRSPAPNPLTYDEQAGAIVSWLPFDPRLPALGEPGAELARRLGEDVGGAEPELLGYKPRGRAVLRLGPLVLKAYGSERHYAAALAGLLAASREGPLPDRRLRGRGTRPAPHRPARAGRRAARLGRRGRGRGRATRCRAAAGDAVRRGRGAARARAGRRGPQGRGRRRGAARARAAPRAP